MSADDAVLAGLSPAKRLLLAELLRGKAAVREPMPALAASGATTAPLAYSQHQLWLAQQLRPDDASYTVPMLLRLTGAIEPVALAAAFGAVVDRHEVLRSVLVADAGGEPEQRVPPPGGFELAVHDLRDRGEAEAEAEARAIAATDAAAPFDLARGCLRVALLRVADRRAYLAIAIHHAAHDGWSTDLLVRELLAVYRAALDGSAAGLSALPAQYGDYARWQRAWIETDHAKRQLAARVERLASLPEPLDVPSDRVRRDGDRGARRGARLGYRFDATAIDGLRRLAATEQATLAHALAAAYAVLLHRYTGKRDFVIATQLANRGLAGTEGLIGYFANTSLLRLAVDPGASFRAVLRGVRDEMVLAADHAQVPFDRVLEAVRARTPGAAGPLFQTMFVYQRAARALPEAPFAIEVVDHHNGTAKFDLDLSIVESGDAVTAALEYDAELFEADTIGRLLGHLARLVASAVEAPAASVGTLAMLSEAERAQAVGPWNATAVEFSRDRCLHELIDDWAQRDPAAPAVLRGDAVINRGELARRASVIAARLRRAGVGRGGVVAVCSDRSPELAAGILGILRAGAAYLPIDPAYPRERIAFMLDDARASIVLAQRARAGELAAPGREVWPIEDLVEDLGGCEGAGVGDSGATAADLCYVIYTSGSTGRPKGVMLDHRGRVNNFADFNRRYAVGPVDRVLAVSSVGFDMCAYDVLGTLAAGAAVVMPDAARALDPAHWLDVIARHRVTLWHSVPALAGLLVDAARATPDVSIASIRVVLLGGDWIPVPLADELRACSPGARVISLGGATEVSMDSTIFEIGTVDRDWRSVPYGRPMANQLAYVLDGSGELCPIGVPGELHLGGIGVGWGYLGHPHLTAERFVPDPFAGGGARMYRTGDLARYGRDGVLELLGRIDFQIKIRGHRIELGEIEAALRALGAGHAIVVAAPAPGSTDKRLVGYVVPTDGETLDAAALREALAARMPSYMVPAHLLVLERFPLTPNGKVDRKQLPAPEALAAPRAAVVAPATERERVVHRLWCELLGLTELSIDDDFFAVGGDSIKAIQLTSRARAIGLALTPAELFRHPTVRALAAAATDFAATASAADVAVALPADVRRAAEARVGAIESAELAGPMQAHMIRRHAEGGVPGLYVNRSGIVLPAVDLDSLRAAWELLVARHATLRTCFAWRGLERPVRVVVPKLELPLRLVDLRGAAPADQERELVRIAAAERRAGFDLETPPLFRLVLARLADDCSILLEHQAYPVLDGWSSFVLRRELLHAYRALAAGEPPALGPVHPFTGYVRWAEAQGTESSIRYWHTALAGVERPPRAELRGSLERVSRWLDADATAALVERARRESVTASSLIALAWGVVERAATGATEAVFGITSSGRSPLVAGCEDVVGLCINTLPCRIAAPGASAIADALRALHAQRARDAAHEVAPLDAIEPGGRLFDSIVVFANYPVDATLRGVEAAEVPFPFAERLHLAQTEFPLRLDVALGARVELTAFYYDGTLAAVEVERRLAALIAALRELAAGRARTLNELVEQP